MSKKAHNEAERVVGNAFYMHHPFRQGGAGLAEFCNLILIKNEISRPFLLGVIIPDLDRLLAALKRCPSCRIKLFYLSSLLCRDRLPECEQRYLAGYRAACARSLSRIPRDYCAEVDEAIRQARHACATPDRPAK